MIYGRSDSTLNRGGVRMGTADFYAVVEGFDEVADSLVIDTTELGARDEGALLCFLVLADGADLSDVEPVLRKGLRSELSPRHVPDRFVVVDAIPRTLNGKKCEVPVKKILCRSGPGEGGQPGRPAEPGRPDPLHRAGGPRLNPSVAGVRRMADRLDVVAVRVADERAVVALVVLGPDPRLVQRLRPERHRRRVEGAYPLGGLRR